MTDTKKLILILGTGKDQLPGIRKARELDLYTVGLDFDSTSPGSAEVDEFYSVNIKNKQEVIDFVSDYKRQIDGVIAFGVDIPDIIALASETAGCFSFISSEMAEMSRNKLTSKNRMKSSGVSLPEYGYVRTCQELMSFVRKAGFPVVIKPLDNSASRGVFLLEDEASAEWAFEESRKFTVNDEEKGLLVEKYLEGPQLSTESLIINGSIYTVGLSDRNYSLLQEMSPYIIENGGDLPPDTCGFPDLNTLIDAVDDELKKAAHAFNVSNGVIKGDIVINNGKVFIIEVAFRLSGGHFSTYEIPLNTGIDFLKHAISVYLGSPVYVEDLKYASRQRVRLRFFLEKKEKNYTLERIEFNEVENSIVGFYCRPGESIGEFSDRLGLPVNKLGFYLVYGNSVNDIERIEKQLLNSVSFVRKYDC